MKKNFYRKKRIFENSISDYIEKVYEPKTVKCLHSYTVKNAVPLLQNELERGNSCSLTSITAAINCYLGGEADVKAVFATVRKVARFFLYSRRGTNPFMIKPIFDISLRKLGIKKRTGVRLSKPAGVNLKKIMHLLNNNVPVVMSMLTDGRGFYRDHTILLVGYDIYEIDGRRRVFLKVHDNWLKGVSYLDYSKLGPICSINYIRK